MSLSLASLLPIRDRRDRVIGFELASTPLAESESAALTDATAREATALIPTFSRLAGRPLLVPVTPAVVREGLLTRFASSDVHFLIATDAIEDQHTRKAVERLAASGIRFALDGFPDGGPLPPVFAGAVIAVDARRTPAGSLGAQLRSLLEAGLRPLVRGVDDRATRQRVLSLGAAMHTGRLLARSASSPVRPELEESLLRALNLMAAFSDGRPTDQRFDTFVTENQYLSASLLKTIGSASLGVRNAKSVGHALSLLGREAVMDRMATVTARLLGDVSQDPEMALMAMRRLRFCEKVGGALDPAPHPRARAVAALLSMLEFALAVPSAALLEHELLQQLPPLLQDVLGARQQRLGALIDVADAMDYGWWPDLRSRSATLGLGPAVVASGYVDAWRAARDDLGISRAESP